MSGDRGRPEVAGTRQIDAFLSDEAIREIVEEIFLPLVAGRPI